MSIKQKILSKKISMFKKIVGTTSISNMILSQLSEELVPVVKKDTNYGPILFFCPGKLPEYRARTALTKEPETIEWINNFDNRSVLWDIGANVGVYSLYSAKKGCTVLSFEPSPSNYYLLGRNIELNILGNKISALCIAFDSETKLDFLYMTNTQLGGALSSFGEAVNWNGNPFVEKFKQSMIGFSIDNFIEQFNPIFPTHIKIDVDGNEHRIIEGARNTLLDKRIKSVMVELDSERVDYCTSVICMLEKAGLKLFRKRHSLEFKNSSCYNYFFHRL